MLHRAGIPSSCVGPDHTCNIPGALHVAECPHIHITTPGYASTRRDLHGMHHCVRSFHHHPATLLMDPAAHRTQRIDRMLVAFEERCDTTFSMSCHRRQNACNNAWRHALAMTRLRCSTTCTCAESLGAQGLQRMPSILCAWSSLRWGGCIRNRFQHIPVDNWNLDKDVRVPTPGYF